MITTAWFIGNEALQDAHSLRRAVFIEEQGIAEAIEIDGTDAACIHLVAYEDEIPAATGRIMITRDDFLIGRVAVLPAYRNRQLGTLIMRMLINACVSMGGETQTVHAQVSAQAFYQKLGFIPVGGVYEEACIPHIQMRHTGGCESECHGCKAGCVNPSMLPSITP